MNRDRDEIGLRYLEFTWEELIRLRGFLTERHIELNDLIDILEKDTYFKRWLRKDLLGD